MNHDIVILQKHNALTEGALGNIKNGLAASIVGMEGSGVTVTCEHIVRTWRQNNPERPVYEFTVGPGEDNHLRFMQFLAGNILGSEMPTPWGLHSPSELTLLIGEKIKKADVGLIFMDRADLAPDGLIDSLLTMVSKCHTKEKPIGMLLGARRVEYQKSLFKRFSASRVGFAENLQPLDASELTTVITNLCPKFAQIEHLLKNNDKAAIDAIMELGRLTSGLFCRLSLFIMHLNDSDCEVEFNAAAMRKLWNKLIRLGGIADAA